MAILARDFTATFSNTNLFSDLLFSIKRFNIIDTKWCLFYFLLGGMIYHYIDVIKDKRITLKVFQKNKDIDLYSYFSPKTREYLFSSFSHSAR